MSQNVKVEIYGQAYTIGGELPAEYMRELALYVDGRCARLRNRRRWWIRRRLRCWRRWRLPMN